MKQFLPLLLLAALACNLSALVKVEVKKLSADYTNLVVHCKLTAAQYSEAKGKALLDERSGESLPYAFTEEPDGAATLSVLLPGIVKSGESRSFAFREGTPAALSSDFSADTQGKTIRVRNQYFSLQHPLVGRGALPTDIAFGFSGNADPSLVFIDRVWSKERGGQFRAQYDDKATARLVSANPLRAVVETQNGYVSVNGDYAEGNPRGRYRFIYTAFSPVVQVEYQGTVEDGYTWPELVFCQVSNEKLQYNRFVWEDPEGVHAKENLPNTLVKPASIPVKKDGWIAMANDADAVGANGPAVGYDAQTGFVYYVRSLDRLKLENGTQASARIYLGPASQNAQWYAAFLSNAKLPVVQAYDADAAAENAAAPTTETAPDSGSQVFEFGDLVLSFADRAHGYACNGIRSKKGGPVFCETSEPAPLWRLNFKNGPAAKETFTRSTLDVPMEKTSIRRDGNTITISWKELPIDETGTADVTATIEVVDGVRAEWRLAVENRSRKAGLWSSEFPILSRVTKPGVADILMPTVQLGGHLQKKGRPYYHLTYPQSAGCTQLFAFLLDGYGLYFAAHDGEAKTKDLRITTDSDAFFTILPENQGVPGSGLTPSFAYATEVFQGDWWRAAKLYRAWAAKGAKWLRHGLIRDNPDYPKAIQELCYWFHSRKDADGMRKYMAEAAERCPVKHGIHWYCWHEIPFDTYYPEFKPTKPGVPAVMRELAERGVACMPYINAHLWDLGIDSWKSDGGIHAASLQPNGENYVALLVSGRPAAPMCPYTEIWQKKMIDISEWLLKECGANAIYLDQIGASKPILCYNPEHGHPLGGGSYWIDGYRKMLDAINREAAKHGAFLTTENTAEPYMDNIHGFLTWIPSVDNNVPLLPAIYSGYTYYFGSPTVPSDTDRAFRMVQGRSFLWGVQLGWETDYLMRGEQYRNRFDYQMQLAQLRAATLDFQSTGELMGEIVPRNDVPTIQESWHCKPSKSWPVQEAVLPAVMGTYWQNEKGELCVYLVNYDDALQPLEYDLPKLGTGKDVLLTRVTENGRSPLEVVPDGARRRVALKPREVAVVHITPADGDGILEQALKDAREAHDVRKDDTLLLAAERFLFLNDTPCEVDWPSIVQQVPGEAARFAVTIRGDFPKDKNFGFSLGTGITVKNAEQTKGKLQIVFAISPEAGEAIRKEHDGVFDAMVFSKDVPGALTFPMQLKSVAPYEVELKLPEQVFEGDPFPCEVTVRNNTSHAQDLRVQLSIPEGCKPACTGAESILLKEVAPNSSRTSSILLVADKDAEVDAAKFTALLVLAEARASTAIKPARPEYRARKAKAFRIDGDLSDWEGRPFVEVGEKTPRAATYKTHAYGGDADLSAKMAFSWDEERLYVAVRLRDDIHVNPDRIGDGFWKGDMIQIDLRDDGPAMTASDTAPLYEFSLCYDEKGASVHTWGNLSHLAGLAEGARKLDGDTAMMEFAIPWKILGMSAPKAGNAYGLSFAIADNDSADTPIERLKSMDGYLEWTKGIFYGKDPSCFAWMYLEE